MRTTGRRQDLLSRLNWLAGELQEAGAEAYALAQQTDERGPRLELERIGERFADAVAAIKAAR